MIAKFDSQGNAGTPATLGASAGMYMGGVALDPTNGNVQAFGFDGSFSPQVATLDPSSGDVIGSPFPVVNGSTIAQIATDSAGNIYVPDPATNVVTQYSSAGTSLATFDCSACPGGAFDFGGTAMGVAAEGSNLYVADAGNSRVVKVAANDPTGASATVLVSSKAAVAVAVNPANGHVFVGGDDGSGYHVVEYDSSGTQVADFGQGDFSNGVGADQIAVNSTTGDVYVTDFGSSSLVFVYSPVQPTATTTAASGLAQTDATLNGTVNPQNGGDISDCHFDWGTDTNYTGGSVNCASNPPDGNSDVAVTADLPGLDANTTYHYQLVVDNGAGPQNGGDQSFTTLPNAPTVTTGGSSGITQHAATIAGTVNPNSGALSLCKFEWGPSAGTYTTGSADCPTDAGSGSSDVAESLNLSGLSPNTTYHYRLIATNAGGGRSTAATCRSPRWPTPAPPTRRSARRLRRSRLRPPRRR